MSLFDDLKNETDKIVKGGWNHRDGEVVPESGDLGLGNKAVDLEATFLYADLADSTQLAVERQEVAAEVCKAYLMGTTRIVRALGGEIRSFDGDRVMGVFHSGAKNTAAAEAALKINYFFSEMLRPAFEDFYKSFFSSWPKLRQTVGIDTGRVMVVRAGIRNNNDLIWIGKAPNVAAKLSSIREGGYSTYISERVFDPMLDTSKFGGTAQQLMWEPRTWADGLEFGTGKLYRSGWTWRPS